MMLLLLALQLSATQLPARRPDSVAERQIAGLVDSRIREFLQHWRYAWQDTQLEIEFDRPKGFLSEVPGDGEARILALHCHFSGTSPRIQKYLIANSTAAHAACPKWYPPDGPRIDDERKNLDGGLSADRRSTIRLLRLSLRALLDSAQVALPRNLDVMRQRVRFALDASDWGGAKQIALSCDIDAVQCGLLRGLVLYRIGNVPEADAEFLSAVKAMPDSARCEWNDVGPLLEGSLRNSYAKMNCAERAEIEARVWWLSDPLYIEQGNERRAEHYARKITISLVAPSGFDGHQHWTRKKGGEATAESEIRYGWPSQMFWGGPQSDEGHGIWLIQHVADSAPPYVTREFTRNGRLHTVPLPSAIENPFGANASDWNLNGDGDKDYDWWPAEHYARERSSIRQLPEGQSVMLRRKDATRFVWVGELDSAEVTRACGDTARASLFVSPWVDEVTRVAEFKRKNRVAVDYPLTAGKTLIGIESPGNAACPALRTRFAIEVPDALASLKTQELSQPLLFEASEESGAPLSADAAITRMYGTTEFHKPRTLGVYFESYNFADDDTVQLEVRMTREDKPGFFTRVAQVFKIGNRESGSIGIRWIEVPGNSRAVHVREGNVPIQMRNIVLDVSRLSRGTYRLELLQSIAGKEPVSGERRFGIR
jgi:hypothetical protein